MPGKEQPDETAIGPERRPESHVRAAPPVPNPFAADLLAGGHEFRKRGWLAFWRDIEQGFRWRLALIALLLLNIALWASYNGVKHAKPYAHSQPTFRYQTLFDIGEALTVVIMVVCFVALLILTWRRTEVGLFMLALGLS